MATNGEIGPGITVELGSSWRVGDALGSGGFGRVFEAQGECAAAIKFVPMAPGAEREMLFVDLDGARNVMPVIDSGEYGGHWVLVMPRAEGSLRNHLDRAAGEGLEAGEAIEVLIDVCDTLVALEGASCAP
ncbi:MAG: hypothetical protein ACR2MB_16265 [Acidimicrobiales bacterium]